MRWKLEDAWNTRDRRVFSKEEVITCKNASR